MTIQITGDAKEIAALVLARVCKCLANFALLGCGLGALCAVTALAEGAGAAALPGLAGCLLGGWAALEVHYQV